MENNIIKEPKLIKLNCYNGHPYTCLVLPLTLGTYHDVLIDTIYFDYGIRILHENPKTQSLRSELELRQEIKKQNQKLLNEVEKESFKTIIKKIIIQDEEEIKNLQKDIIKSQSYNIEDLLKLSNGAKNIYLFSFFPQKKTFALNPYFVTTF